MISIQGYFYNQQFAKWFMFIPTFSIWKQSELFCSINLDLFQQIEEIMSTQEKASSFNSVGIHYWFITHFYFPIELFIMSIFFNLFQKFDVPLSDKAYEYENKVCFAHHAVL